MDDRIGRWTMDDGRWGRGRLWTTDDGGFLTADRGPQTAKVGLADRPIPSVSFFPLASIPPLDVIPETGGLNFFANENASFARYPGSREDWLYRTTDYGRQRG